MCDFLLSDSNTFFTERIFYNEEKKHSSPNDGLIIVFWFSSM